MAKYRMSKLQSGYTESSDEDVKLTFAGKDMFADVEAETRNTYDEVVRIYDVQKNQYDIGRRGCALRLTGTGRHK